MPWIEVLAPFEFRPTRRHIQVYKPQRKAIMVTRACALYAYERGAARPAKLDSLKRPLPIQEADSVGD